MTPQDSVTEGEGWSPLGVQCQVHCIPLMQANARVAADSPDGCGEEKGAGAEGVALLSEGDPRLRKGPGLSDVRF